MSRTPQEFALHCAERASLWNGECQFICFALGILAGAAIEERRSFPDYFIDQAEGCHTLADIEALQELMTARKDDPPVPPGVN